MNRKLWVHVGHGKTGSSFIQSVLATNAPLLKEHGILYPVHDSFESAKKGFISTGNGELLISDRMSFEATTLFSSEIRFSSC